MSAGSAVGPPACVVCGAHLVEGAQFTTCGVACGVMATRLRRFVEEGAWAVNAGGLMALESNDLVESSDGADWRLTDHGRDVALALGLDVSAEGEHSHGVACGVCEPALPGGEEE